MPGRRIKDLTALSGAGSANNDDVVIFDTNADTTKRISRSQLAEGMIGDLPFLYFHGVRTTDPTQRFNGDSLVIGDGYLRSSDMIFRYYTSSGWQNYEQISIAAAQAWAEGTLPGGAGTYSSKEWSETSEAWAVNPEDTAVEPSKYSALHYAAKAQGYANVAGVAVGYFDREDVTALTSDTTLTYTAGQPGTVAAGDIIRTRAEGFAYEVATSGATNQHVTTAGGVKLYALNQTSFTDELALRKPRKMWAKIFRMASTVDRLVWVPVGDSLASRKFVQIVGTLDRMIGGVMTDGVNTTGSNVNTRAGDQLYETDYVNVTSAVNYDIVPAGAYRNIAAGGSLRFIYGGVNPAYTTVKFFYVKEPGAGVISLSVGGVVVATADANAVTTELGVLQYTVGAVSTQNLTTMSVAGAAVKLIGGIRLSEDIRGVVKFTYLAVGGITPTQLVQTATSRLIHQQLLQQANPDIVTLEMDDNFADGGGNQTALNTIADLWDATIPYVDKLLIGSTPRASGDIGKLQANLRIRQVAKQRGTSYLYFDSYTIMGSYAEQVAIFGADDGVHPNVAASAFAAEAMWNYLGLSSLNLMTTPKAVNSQDAPSTMFRGTKLRGGVDELLFQTDATFGYDWDVVSNRSLNFKDKSGNTTLRVSHNAAVFRNVLPMGWDFGTGGARKVSFTDGTTYQNSSINFTDSGMTSTYLTVRAQGLALQGIAKASLPFAPAHQGSIRWCTNARSDGGPCFIYADATATWKRVADDAAVV